MVGYWGIIQGPGIIYLDSPKDQANNQGPGNNWGNTEHAQTLKLVPLHILNVFHKCFSLFAGLFHKCKLLWPFMWPKGDFYLQVRVMFCVFIVVATRGVTVLVPIYYKKIGEYDDMFLDWMRWNRWGRIVSHSCRTLTYPFVMSLGWVV